MVTGLPVALPLASMKLAVRVALSGRASQPPSQPESVKPALPCRIAESADLKKKIYSMQE